MNSATGTNMFREELCPLGYDSSMNLASEENE